MVEFSKWIHFSRHTIVNVPLALIHRDSTKTCNTLTENKDKFLISPQNLFPEDLKFFQINPQYPRDLIFFFSSVRK